MPAFPHSHLFVEPKLTVVISGPHIQVLQTSTGDTRYTTLENDSLKDAVVQSGPIRCAAVDKTGSFLLTSGEDKVLKLWELEGLKLVNQRELPKRPTAVRFTEDGQTLLVADKFGDVFSYPFDYTPPPPPTEEEKQKQAGRDSLASHENPSGGQLILGHASLLLAFLLSADEKYVITSDRDEHIRVSWFPQGYNIERYCLGHSKFVSALHTPSFAPSDIVSGGGDPVLKIWDWKAGVVKNEIGGVWDAVEPYLVVFGRSGKRKRERQDVGESPGQRRIRRGKGKKSKQKGKDREEEADVDAEAEGLIAEDDERQKTEDIQDTDPDPQQKEAEKEKVLVIHKIDTWSSTGGRHIIFNAVGATALFAASYPEGDDQPSGSVIDTFGFGRPVVDFFVTGDGLIWVFLDGNFVSPSSPEGSIGPTKFVRTLELSSGKLKEATAQPPLLDALNSKCLLEATQQDLEKLDLYNDLISMPKSSADAEQEQEADVSLPKDNEKPQTKRTLARLKTKQAVQDRLQQVNTGGPSAPANEEDELEEPEPKKTKSVNEGSEGGNDAAMADP